MNDTIVPSLIVIGAVGAMKSGALDGARHIVWTSAAQSDRKSAEPKGQWDFGTIAKWAGGIAGLTAVGLIFGSGDGPMSDVVGALLLLTAGSVLIVNIKDIVSWMTRGSVSKDASKASTAGTSGTVTM